VSPAAPEVLPLAAVVKARLVLLLVLQTAKIPGL
jgi:hypothetical protein